MHDIRFLRAGTQIFQKRDHDHVHTFSFHGSKAIKELIIHSRSSSDMQLRHVQAIRLLDWVHFKNYMNKDSQRTPGTKGLHPYGRYRVEWLIRHVGGEDRAHSEEDKLVEKKISGCVPA